MIVPFLIFASADTQGTHWEAMGRANEVASICSIRQGVRLDDKRTSPEIVARAAMAACHRELLEMDQSVATNAAIEIPTVPQEQRNATVAGHVQAMRKRIEDLTIQAILERRMRHAPNK